MKQECWDTPISNDDFILGILVPNVIQCVACLMRQSIMVALIIIKKGVGEEEAKAAIQSGFPIFDGNTTGVIKAFF